MEYSFCWTEVSVLTCTLPWQAGEAHDPGPVYFGGPGFCANVRTENNVNRRPERIRSSVLEEQFSGNLEALIKLGFFYHF
jgi:hypothetical protein